jgi:murein L,D-transpeptidase YafK
MFLLSAKDIYDVYRYDGIKNVEKILEQSIQMPSFWLNKLENRDVSFGYFEAKKYVLFCNKLKRTLSLYYVNQGKFKYLKTFKVIVLLINDSTPLKATKKEIANILFYL